MFFGDTTMSTLVINPGVMVLTDEASESSYGVPVLVETLPTSGLRTAYGPGDRMAAWDDDMLGHCGGQIAREYVWDYVQHTPDASHPLVSRFCR